MKTCAQLVNELIDIEGAKTEQGVDFIMESNFELLVNKVKADFQGCKIGLPAETFLRYEKSFRPLDWGYVYLEDDYLALGSIGFRDLRDNPTKHEPAFTISSPSIRNEKYKSNHDNYRAVRTKSLKKAVSQARQSLRPMSMRDIMGNIPVDLSTVKSAAKVVLQEGRDKTMERFRKVKDHPDLTMEFRNLLNSGYQFVSGSFKDAIAHYIEAVETYTQSVPQIDFKVVFPIVVDGQQHFRVGTWENALGWMHNVSSLEEGYTEATLPEHMARKLAMLMIVEEKQYVENVGLKFKGLYYVNA